MLPGLCHEPREKKLTFEPVKIHIRSHDVEISRIKRRNVVVFIETCDVQMTLVGPASQPEWEAQAGGDGILSPVLFVKFFGLAVRQNVCRSSLTVVET